MRIVYINWLTKVIALGVASVSNACVSSSEYYSVVESNSTLSRELVNLRNCQSVVAAAPLEAERLHRRTPALKAIATQIRRARTAEQRGDLRTAGEAWQAVLAVNSAVLYEPLINSAAHFHLASISGQQSSTTSRIAHLKQARYWLSRAPPSKYGFAMAKLIDAQSGAVVSSLGSDRSFPGSIPLCLVDNGMGEVVADIGAHIGGGIAGMVTQEVSKRVLSSIGLGFLGDAVGSMIGDAASEAFVNSVKESQSESRTCKYFQSGEEAAQFVIAEFGPGTTIFSQLLQHHKVIGPALRRVGSR